MASQANPYGVTTALRNAKLKINPQLITDFVTLGLGWVRLMVLWTSIELTPGVYDASALDVLDDAVHRCNLAGLNVQFPIQQPPAWHQVAADCDPGSNVHHMADPTSVANFANFLSKRYNGVTNVPNYGPLTIAAFEVGNEEFDVYFCAGFPTTVAGQPCRDPKWFIPCLKAASPVIRANSPNALVGMNAMWWEDTQHHITFMQALYDNGCKTLFDYANIHLYPSPTPPGTDVTSQRLSVGGQINEVYNVMAANNDAAKNVWVTEWGAPTTDMTDAARVTWFNDFLDICRNNGHVGVTNIYTMNYTDPLVNPASQSFSLTQFNAPHYTQTFYGVQAYIAKFPTWGGLPPPPPPPPPKSTIPHVCVVALENHSYTSVLGNASFPHINALLSTYGYATKFYAVSHPSLPNYVGFGCGSTHGISNDSYNPATSPLGGNTLVDSMANASPAIGWKHYAENLPSTGYLGGDSGGYVQHHNPWVYFGTVRSSTSQHNNIVNYSDANVGLAHDLTAGTAPPFMFVQPNNTNNGHTGTDTQCDNWVNTFMTLIQASTWYTANDGQIVLWWDESHPDTDTAGIGDANPGGGHVMFIVINAENSAATFTGNVNHFGLLRALEELYKLPFLNKDAHSINGDPTPLFSQPTTISGNIITASTTALSYSGIAGGTDPASQTVTLTNTGASSASYTTASTQSWLTVSPTSGTIGASPASITSTLSVSLAGLAAGTYTGKITYTGPSNAIIVTVTLQVASSGPAGALTAYLTGTASSTLSTANLIYTASGGSAVVNNATQIGTLKGYGELFSQGTTNAWAALGTAPAPSGHGWLLDSSVLEGNDLVGGTYTAALRLKTSGTGAVSITADIHCRMYKRSSGGIYTAIADCVLLNRTIPTSNTTFAPSFTTAGNTSFATGDKLYIDLVPNILTNTGPSTLTITVSDLSLETGSLTGLSTAAVVTPGYLTTLPSPPPPPGSTALSLYGSSAVASAIATAGKLAIATGGTAALQPTKLGIATGYGEIYALGNANAWAAVGSIGAPSGNGWVLDASEIDLAGQQIIAGNWVPNVTLSLSDTGGGVGTGSTALTVYGTSVVASTLATAGKLATTTGGSGARQSCLLGTATGWGEMYALGNSGAWAAAGSIGAPSGHGWLWDVTTLEAQQIIAGTWRPTVRASLVGAGTIKADISVRAYKRSSGGTYTLIGTFSITGRSITGTTATFTPVAAGESLMTFTTGDKLYLDCWMQVTANTLGNSSLNFGVELATSGTAGVANAMQMTTPGYQATGGGGGSGAITADVIMRAFVYNANAITYTPIGTFGLSGQSIDGTPSVYSLAPLNLAALNFNANETVYLDLWPSVTANTLASSTLQINASLATGGTAGVANAMQLDTPGYQAQGGGGKGGGGGPPITANSCIIGGQAYMTLGGTTQVANAIGRISQANMTVKTDSSTFFQQYQTVQVYDNNAALAFNGYIMQPVTTKPGFQNSLVHTMSCIDQHFLAAKRVVAASYSNKTIGAIAQDIYSNILVSEGVTVGQIFDGLIPSLTLYPQTTLYPQGTSDAGLIPQAIFAYCTVAAAFDALVKAASAAGVPYYWQIDSNYQLWVVPYTAVINPTVVDGSLIDDGRASGTVPSITRANPSYRNTQYIVGGVAQTLQQTNIRAGDGNVTAWTMDFDLASAPVVSVNLNGAGYDTKTVGIRGIDTGKDFYWQKGNPDITQDSGGTKLRGPTGTIDLLQVVYTGQYPTVILDANAAQVAYEASIDGTTGIIEEVENDSTLSSVANGLSLASSLLTRYACQGAQFVFATLQSGYAPGQLVTVDYPPLGILNAQMLIESISMSDQQDGYNFWYVITAIQGPYDVTWVDFFSKLLAQSQPANSINVGVGASVPLSASFTGGMTISATLITRITASPIPSLTLYPSTSLYPS